MSLHRLPIEIPELTIIDDDEKSVQFQSDVSPIVEEHDPRPVAVCLFTRNGKPLEAKYFDLSLKDDQNSIMQLLQDSACDELPVGIWSKNIEHSSRNLIKLFQSFVKHYDRGEIQQTAFIEKFVKAARSAIYDFNDIQDLLNFVEPLSNQEDISDDE